MPFLTIAIYDLYKLYILENVGGTKSRAAVYIKVKRNHPMIF